MLNTDDGNFGGNFQTQQFHQHELLIATVILTVISITVIISLILLVFRQKHLEKKIDSQNKQIYRLTYESEDDYRRKVNQLNFIIDEQNQVLSGLVGMSIEQAKEKLAENLRMRYRSYYNAIAIDEKKNINENLHKYAQEILISSIEEIVAETVIQRTTSTIKLPNDNIKGKIIGKDGKNKRMFECLTGVDLIIEKQPEITISCTNPIRRQLAKNVMETLLKLKNIEINRIETIYDSEKTKLEEFTKKIGKEILEDKLQIHEFDEKLHNFVGKLHYRYSYGQNVLQHCSETANIAMIIASKLNVDVEKAKRAAFFHDIGKAIDYEDSFDHVKSGLMIAEKFNFPDYIKNAIESHHNKVEPNNIYSAIVKIADEISASRPGARINGYDEYIKHIAELEEIAMSFPAVIKAYGMRSGRILRIIVQPDKIAGNQLQDLGKEIIEKIEENPLTNLHAVKVIIICEKRIELTTNVNGKNKKII